MAKTWRDLIRKMIDQAKEAGTAKGLSGKPLRAYLIASFPLMWSGSSWHRRVWLHEVRRALGRSPKPFENPKRDTPAKGQMELF
jgi:hypothetical protein